MVDNINKQMKDLANWKPNMKVQVKPETKNQMRSASDILVKNVPEQQQKTKDDGRYESWQWTYHKMLYGKSYDLFNDLWMAGVYPYELLRLSAIIFAFIIFPIVALLVMGVLQ